ncbi:MAG: ATP-grasp domain-containing protein [Hyphomicrobium sp.]
MTKTVLLTIGRLPKALDIARGFAGAGWRVIVADPFRWHLTRVSNAIAKCYAITSPVTDRARYLSDIRAVIDSERVELVVPVSEETMYVAALRDVLAPGVSIFTMPQDLVLELYNKRTFANKAHALGLDAPKTCALGDPGAGAIAASGDYVIKPECSCSGRGVRFFTRNTPLPATQADEPEIAQQRIAGDLYSTFSIAHRGEARVTVVYRAAVMSGTVAVCFERVPDMPAIAAWVDAFVAATTYTGFVSFDMIVDAEGRAYAIECNPRATSGAHFVTPEFLIAAILDQPTDAPAFRKTLFMQQFYPCLTETQTSLFDPPRFKANLRHLISAQDVSWARRDPLPFLLMPATASQILWRSIVKKQSFGEASTFDISWRPAR